MAKVAEKKEEVKDLLPKGDAIIPTKPESLVHDKTTNVHGIHEGKRPKFVTHPKE